MYIATIGEIIELANVDNADNLLSAKVSCGKSGEWTGVIAKTSGIKKDDLVEVFLPDALLPEVDRFRFMENRKYRISIARFRGALSQVLIMPITDSTRGFLVGDDISGVYGIKKYEKPVTDGSQQIGIFPIALAPKTDEPHFQIAEKPTGLCVATMKMDGSSMTILYVIDELFICSRNYRVRGGKYARAASKIDTQKILTKYPEVALQFEVVGPGVQGNKAGIKQVEGIGFYAYNTAEQMYLSWNDTKSIMLDVGAQHVKEVEFLADPNLDESFYLSLVERTVYDNGKPAEGIVVRPVGEMRRNKKTFKYISPLYG